MNTVTPSSLKDRPVSLQGATFSTPWKRYGSSPPLPTSSAPRRHSVVWPSLADVAAPARQLVTPHERNGARRSAGSALLLLYGESSRRNAAIRARGVGARSHVAGAPTLRRCARRGELGPPSCSTARLRPWPALGSGPRARIGGSGARAGYDRCASSYLLDVAGRRVVSTAAPLSGNGAAPYCSIGGLSTTL
jgi:hypothetical protein